MSTLIVIGLAASLLIYAAARLSRPLGAFLLMLLSGAGTTALILSWGKGFTETLPLGKGLELTFSLSTFNWPFLLLGAFVLFIVSLFAVNALKEMEHGASFLALLTLIGVSVLGVFGAYDFLTLFIFFELMTWTSFFLVSMGKKGAKKAALIYAFMSMIAAYLMISAIMMIAQYTGSFSYADFMGMYESMPSGIRTTVILFFLVAALIKGGIYPVHFWLRSAHGDAPHVFSPVLSGLLVKYGYYSAYLFLLFFPVMVATKAGITQVTSTGGPNFILAFIGGLSIMAGTVAAILQSDAKKLVAFSSVSHGGYIILALAYGTNMAVAGGLAHIWVHVLTALGMFLSMAAVAYRTGTTDMDEMGGLIKNMPVTFTVYLIAIISVAGIPPLAGFVSKWMIIQALAANGSYILAFMAFFGSIGSFMYVFRPLATVFLGQRPHKYKEVKEVPFFMQLSMIIVTLLTILLGIMPYYLLKPFTRIQEFIGMVPVKIGFSTVYSALTQLDMMLIFLVFGGGFLLALALFLLFSKPTKVEQHEVYTSGEIAPEISTTPEIYHFSKGYYRSFGRLFSRWPSVEAWYHKGATTISQFFEIIEQSLFKQSINGFIWLAVVVMAVLMAVRWF